MLFLEWKCDECGRIEKFLVTRKSASVVTQLLWTAPLEEIPWGWQFVNDKLICDKHAVTISPVPDDPTISQ